MGKTKEARSGSRRTNMFCPNRLSQWSKEVSTAFSHLSKPQVSGLVLWSAGIALTGTAGTLQISALLALVRQQQEQSDQHPHSQLLDPCGLESAGRARERVVASALGRTANRTQRQHPSRLAGAGDGGSGFVCPLVISGDLRLRLASVLSHQSGSQSLPCGRGNL
jgi:hypothetical protein